MKTIYQYENNVVLDENSVEWKPWIKREMKSLELTIKLYSCHDINMKFLVVVSTPSIYQEPSKKSSGLPSLEPHYFSSIPSFISYVVPPCIDYYGNKYDVYNDYKCNDVDSVYGFITSYSYVGDFNREEWCIGAVDICP